MEIETEVRPTRLHRMLNAELGRVPRWLCSNAHEGTSVADLLPISVMALGAGASSALIQMIGYWVIPLVFATMIVGAVVRRETQQLKQIERKCRARIRRHECLYCGAKIYEIANSLSCPACISQKRM